MAHLRSQPLRIWTSGTAEGTLIPPDTNHRLNAAERKRREGGRERGSENDMDRQRGCPTYHHSLKPEITLDHKYFYRAKQGPHHKSVSNSLDTLYTFFFSLWGSFHVICLFVVVVILVDGDLRCLSDSLSVKTYLIPSFS